MGFIVELIDQLQEGLERHKNRPLLRATMAACALIAVADREVSFSERVRVDQILETLEKLRVFDPHEGVNLFNAFSDAILKSPKKGRALALAEISPMAEDPETARLLVRVCLAVSAADPGDHLVDQIEIVSLCGVIGVDPRNLGLYPDTGIESVTADT
ncbi:MAG: tellurite resistance TerB family protein [Hyphomicrobiales bacterium]|nr:tellurite resistance TerB family protein [Hyphomicrobiales bacterium]MCP5372715.1 tellurite resistance TerB family protein [Hyphomicrobiales bacterium]